MLTAKATTTRRATRPTAKATTTRRVTRPTTAKPRQSHDIDTGDGGRAASAASATSPTPPGAAARPQNVIPDRAPEGARRRDIAQSQRFRNRTTGRIGDGRE